MDNKKINIMLTITIIILLVIAGLCFYIAYDKGLIFNSDNNEEVNNNDNGNNVQTNDEIHVEGIELTDSKIIDALNENIKILSRGEYGCFPPIIENLYMNNLDNSTISVDDKLLLSLYSIWKVAEGPESSKKISAQTVEQHIYKLFGETKNINHKSLAGCPIYTYNENQKIYTYSFACGGGCSPDVVTYNFDYRNEDNKYYVYQSFGRFGYDYGDSEEDDTIVTIYKDYNKTQVYKTGTFDELKNFEINSGNFQDFSAYKWTFIKDSEGNYIFDSLKRIK